MLSELAQRATRRPWDPAMTTALVWTWLGLQIAGQVLLLLLTATLFFSRRLRSQRHPVLINFVVTWLISTIPACLLLYGNGYDRNQPSWGLCLYNAALMSGVPPMVSLAFLAVVIQMYIMMRCVTNQKEYVRRPWLTVLLIAAPYVAFVIVALITGIIGFYDPANVLRQPEIVFCVVRNHNIGKSIWGFTILVVAATLAVGLALVLLMWRNWRGVRQNSIVDMNFVIRALCFTVFELFMLTTYMLSVFLDSIPPKFMQALAPLAVFLIFSTQPDVLRACFFCLGRKDVAVTAPKASQQARSFDEEKGSPGSPQDYSPQNGSNNTTPPRAVLSSRFSTVTLITALPETVSAPNHVLGLRTLRLASSVSAPAPAHRPTHGYSNSAEGRPRVVGTHTPTMHSPAPSYSDLSYRSASSGRSTGSGAPLLRTTTLGSPERALYNSSTLRRSEAGVMESTADSRPNSTNSRALGNRI